MILNAVFILLFVLEILATKVLSVAVTGVIRDLDRAGALDLQKSRTVFPTMTMVKDDLPPLLTESYSWLGNGVGVAGLGLCMTNLLILRAISQRSQ